MREREREKVMIDSLNIMQNIYVRHLNEFTHDDVWAMYVNDRIINPGQNATEDKKTGGNKIHTIQLKTIRYVYQKDSHSKHPSFSQMKTIITAS